MNKKRTALLCVGIPSLIGVLLVITFGIACILEMPTHRGLIYAIFALISIFGSILAPIPCIASSIIGIISAIKSKKQGEKTGHIILIGVLNIVIALVIEIAWLYIIFVAGAGV